MRLNTSPCIKSGQGDPVGGINRFQKVNQRVNDSPQSNNILQNILLFMKSHLSVFGFNSYYRNLFRNSLSIPINYRSCFQPSQCCNSLIQFLVLGWPTTIQLFHCYFITAIFLLLWIIIWISDITVSLFQISHVELILMHNRCRFYSSICSYLIFPK